jgi:spore maturation protein SpmB
MVPVTVAFGQVISPWILPGLMLGFLGFGVVRRVQIYEVFVEGAKVGFKVAIKIIPYLVAILVAVGMFRASGALGAVVGVLGPWTTRIGLPAEALPMALMRPLSGSGAYGILASIVNDTAIGPDSYTGYLVSTLQGSTETTFYVLAVYFGAVQVRRIRHALAAALTADVAGVIFAIIACSLLLG